MKLIKNIAAYRLGRPKNLKIVSVWHIRKFTYRDRPGLKAQLHAFRYDKWGMNMLYSPISIMFRTCMPGWAGSSKISHTNNDVSFLLHSKKKLKLHAWSSANIVYACDSKVWVHLISHFVVLWSWVNLNMILYHTLTKIEILVRNPVTAVEMSIKLVYIA